MSSSSTSLGLRPPGYSGHGSVTPIDPPKENPETIQFPDFAEQFKQLESNGRKLEIRYLKFPKIFPEDAETAIASNQYISFKTELGKLKLILKNEPFESNIDFFKDALKIVQKSWLKSRRLVEITLLNNAYDNLINSFGSKLHAELKDTDFMTLCTPKKDLEENKNANNAPQPFATDEIFLNYSLESLNLKNIRKYVVEYISSLKNIIEIYKADEKTKSLRQNEIQSLRRQVKNIQNFLLDFMRRNPVASLRDSDTIRYIVKIGTSHIDSQKTNTNAEIEKLIKEHGEWVSTGKFSSIQERANYFEALKQYLTKVSKNPDFSNIFIDILSNSMPDPTQLPKNQDFKNSYTKLLGTFNNPPKYPKEIYLEVNKPKNIVESHRLTLNEWELKLDEFSKLLVPIENDE